MIPAVPNTKINTSINYTEYLFPLTDEIPRYEGVIYPYLNSADPTKASMDSDYGLPSSQYLPPEVNKTSQPISPAGGGIGGSPGLWEPVVNVTANIFNTGVLAGHEVVQLHVLLGGDEPPHLLRAFDRLYIEPGESATFEAQLLRRDVSIWDPGRQDWEMVKGFTVFVGSLSRKLPLSAEVSL